MDLVKSARSRGYKLDSSQISRILNREQAGGLEATIAIAHGLGISREDVFRVRGWLLTEPERLIDPEQDSPQLVALVNLVRQLTDEQRRLLLDAWEATLKLATTDQG